MTRVFRVLLPAMLLGCAPTLRELPPDFLSEFTQGAACPGYSEFRIGPSEYLRNDDNTMDLFLSGATDFGGGIWVGRRVEHIVRHCTDYLVREPDPPRVFMRYTLTQGRIVRSATEDGVHLSLEDAVFTPALPHEDDPYARYSERDVERTETIEVSSADLGFIEYNERIQPIE